MRLISQLLLVFVAVLFAACGGGENRDKADVVRLPLVYAPLDTLQGLESRQTDDSGIVATSSDVGLSKPAWLTARLSGHPPAKALRYVRYENPQYGYSFAYPDTLFEPVQPIGDGRGMEFATRDSSSRILVFAIEDAGREDLERQYQAALSDLEARVTYRAREEEWYIVAGTQRDHVFYEKGILGGGRLKTFRINYPPENRSYFDAVTAVMASSFK